MKKTDTSPVAKKPSAAKKSTVAKAERLPAADAIPEVITRVGVFVNQPNEEIVRIANRCRLNIIQLHGSESVANIMALRKMLPEDTKVMKAISVSDANDVKKADSYADVVDILLFDTKCQTVGGSGKQFEWSVLDGYNGVLPFLLSGGIGPDDAERLASFHHPKMIGIDLTTCQRLHISIKNQPRFDSRYCPIHTK